jgi:hypothetical protein
MLGAIKELTTRLEKLEQNSWPYMCIY